MGAKKGGRRVTADEVERHRKAALCHARCIHELVLSSAGDDIVEPSACAYGSEG
ncbi:MAG: hypothetical protein QOF15_2929 [Mycobacterium sp.]|nr:hypothetical protein [Mycobacterium sp.]